MGKTSKPLSILIHPSIADWDEWQELRDKGHTIEVMESSTHDVIFGPYCWRMEPLLKKYVTMAVAEARKVRYKK